MSNTGKITWILNLWKDTQFKWYKITKNYQLQFANTLCYDTGKEEKYLLSAAEVHTGRVSLEGNSAITMKIKN